MHYELCTLNLLLPVTCVVPQKKKELMFKIAPEFPLQRKQYRRVAGNELFRSAGVGSGQLISSGLWSRTAKKNVQHQRVFAKQEKKHGAARNFLPPTGKRNRQSLMLMRLFFGGSFEGGSPFPTKVRITINFWV